MVSGTINLLIGLKHLQAIGDLMCADFTDTHGHQVVYGELDIPSLLSERKPAGLRTFYLAQTVAACNSTGLSTKPIIQFINALGICLHSDVISTGD